ncbi:carbamoyl-phosphate synthase (glutamine-hydrolyzing) large subunit [Thermicanus aegyptius]|uniref:carbamoyl-phosphate synthase (glutamine-hydrolyzing) large subunit n=1 Tax=Thermicanus aegyptius TaxID=94009 RepID=UPI000423DA6F|nr:carbamoyl-phosphate synthase (glutamine-hydrolyzing) large subunit [Thermicanus aegyptius]
MPLDKDLRKVLVIGSGPIVIGQAAEFDYAGTQACLALKEEGIKVVLINNNPATIMTDPAIADALYLEPLTVESVEKVIARERPDGLIATLGGQTGLNLATELYNQGILKKYGVKVLGTSIAAIKKGEDREAFRNLMLTIGEPIPESKVVHTVEEGVAFAEEIGYPLILRPAYTLGGEGGGFAGDREELLTLLPKALSLSPIHQVLLERSIRGWKEIEYEVMRDANDTAIIVCNMENFDPVGVHTGDSIVVAPAQTLTDREHQMLRSAAIKVIRALGVIGGCNIQFALDPHSNRYTIIEVNPRVSRSSALASKATGYPIARIATKCAIGYHLDEILNPVTGHTFAAFEPSLDYVVVKLPRFPFDKFTHADRTLGTQMKATGETMAIDRTFEGAFYKALRSLEMKHTGLLKEELEKVSEDLLMKGLISPHDLRPFYLAEAFRRGMSIDEMNRLTSIDAWFLGKIKKMVDLEQELREYEWLNLPDDLLRRAKEIQLPDARIAEIYKISEEEIRNRYKRMGISPGFKMVDTCAAEFEAATPYYYSTWKGYDEARALEQGKKVVVLGSGPIRIGQGVEFDYASVHAVWALKETGIKAIVINNNPETVSTDFSVADRLYFEPLAPEDILHIIEKEKADGVLIQFGGQTAINVAKPLEKAGVNIIGPTVDAIDQLEDRERFYALLERLDIPHIRGEMAKTPEELRKSATRLGFPILVRPSYVIGGQSMVLFYSEVELLDYLASWKEYDEASFPTFLVDQYLPGLECEVDLICDGEEVLIPGVFEHVERAGVHSGDSFALFPSVTLSQEIKKKIEEYSRRITRELNFSGIMNIQFLLKDEVLYVLEVNPRASRTVPIVSKVTGIPMVEWAVHALLGKKISEMTEKKGLIHEPFFYTVKAPIFSTGKLKGVDPVLGPEMKSTGEVLSLGCTPEEALRKAFSMGGFPPLSKKELEGKGILLAISDREKERSLPLIHQLSINIRSILYATRGTARFLKEHGIAVQKIVETKEEVLRLFKEKEITMGIVLPTHGGRKKSLGYTIRETALRQRVPLFTCIDTLKYFLQTEEVPLTVRSLEGYRLQNSSSPVI